MKYPIPKGDVLTQIQPRQHTLFWADGQPGRGTFHVNFVLDPSKENYIALYDADGKTLIDEVTIPAGQMADISYGRVIDGKDEWAQLKKVTPSTNNLTLDSNEKIDNFKQNDSLGIGMTITAMAVVFLGLFCYTSSLSRSVDCLYPRANVTLKKLREQQVYRLTPDKSLVRSLPLSLPLCTR